MANADRIIHLSDTLDPSTRLPLVVVDSTALPPPDSDRFSQCVSSAIAKLPKSNYVLLFFACGAPSKPSWSWVAKTYAMLERPTKKRIKKIYVVHESWWVRAMIEMLRGVVSSKFKSKIVHVSSLSQLAQLIDITLINIRPSIYLHDRKIQDQITVPRHPTPVYGLPLHISQEGTFIAPQVWSDLMNYLRAVAPQTKRIFRPTDSPDLLCILRDCFDRGQLIDLDDYGPYLAASALKLYLYQLPSVVLPVGAILLPIQDTHEYCLDIFNSLSEPSRVLLGELLDLLALIVVNQLKTNQTPSTLAACIGPSLMGLSAVSKESISIGVRYTRNLIEYLPLIRSGYNSYDAISGNANTRNNSISHESIRNGLSMKKRPIPPPVPPSRGTSQLGMPAPSQLGINSPIPPTIALSSPSSPLLHSRNISTPELHTPRPLPASKRSDPLVLQPIEVDNIDPSSIDKTLQSPIRRFGPRSKSVVSTGRGKMVAELAKLYEERSQSAQILVNIDRHQKD
jgi:Rho GTPase-activating protein 1